MNYSSGSPAGQELSQMSKYANSIAPATPPPNQIEGRLQELAKVAEELRSVVAGLQVRLQDVLTPQMKGEKDGAVGTPKPIVAPLADRLDAANGDLSQSIRLLRDIYDRIAL